jgi:hypothetical protein
MGLDRMDRWAYTTPIWIGPLIPGVGLWMNRNNDRIFRGCKIAAHSGQPQ